ncbi:hypothetical protein FRC00_000768 [Tulasnella sp. 408]|nr:hypothetical protein FRC00_000768 [Tulasnella sp. 408]
MNLTILTSHLSSVTPSMAPQISSGLAYLHTRITSIVHGDVKPENVVLSVEGVPKLVDFGLSTIWDDPTFQALRTSDGCRHTPLYADPVLLDDTPRTIYTDLWAFGWIIYELATSRRPYHHRKSVVAIMNAISNYELPTRDTDVVPHPEIIWPILNACWAKDFSNRWSAGKIASKLMQAL